jgi:hypothetical protein
MLPGLAREFSKEQDFLRSKVPLPIVLQLWKSVSPECHFPIGKVRLLQRSSESGRVYCSDTLLPREDRGFFPRARSALMRLLCGKSSS